MSLRRPSLAKSLWGTAIVVAVALSGGLLLAGRETRAVGVPDGVLVRGHLTDLHDRPVEAGSFNVRAAVFPTESGGAEICTWLETGILVHHGNFSITIGGPTGAGTCTALAALVRDNRDLWVELAIQSASGVFETLAPRIAVGATARVHHAEITEALGSELAARLVPTGATAMFDGDCPAGWARAPQFDGLLPRGAAAAGETGGSPFTSETGTHTHGITASGGHNHGGLNSVVSHAGHGMHCAMEGGGWHLNCWSWEWVPHHFERSAGTQPDGGPHAHSTSAQGDHTHPVSAAPDHRHDYLPPYRDLVFCTKL
jgi:hypothetical protein